MAAVRDKPAISVAILDTLPIPLMLVNRDVQLLWVNRSAHNMIKRMRTYRDLGKSGEVLGCVHALETAGGCGCSAACADCVLQHSVRQAFEGREVHQRKTTMHVQTPEGCKDIHLLVTATPMCEGEDEMVLLCLQDISELIQLRSLIPICSSCKKIRNDDSYWQSLETHFHERLDIRFSHSICPECKGKLYPGLEAEGESPKP